MSTDGKVAFLLGKGVKGMDNEVMVEVGRWLVKCWQKRKDLMFDLATYTTTIGSTTHYA